MSVVDPCCMALTVDRQPEEPLRSRNGRGSLRIEMHCAVPPWRMVRCGLRWASWASPSVATEEPSSAKRAAQRAGSRDGVGMAPVGARGSTSVSLHLRASQDVP
jgi:hypothetical protein